MMHMTLWIIEELKILKEKYSDFGSEIPALLQRHTRKAIQHKANKFGLKYRGNFQNILGKLTSQKHFMICDFCGCRIKRPPCRIKKNKTGFFYCSKHKNSYTNLKEKPRRRNLEIWKRLRRGE